MNSDARIAELKRATEQMAQGQFHVDVPPSKAGDAIDDLGRSLSHLSEALDLRFREIWKIISITEKINAGLLLDEVLDYVYTEFASVIPYDRIGFSLLEDNNRILRARWAKSKAPRMEITGGYCALMAGSSLQPLLESGAPRILNDLEAYLAAKPASDSTRRVVAEGMRSSLTCPLLARGRPVGFMFFSSMQKDAYRGAHVELFQRIAGQLSVILEKSRLYQEVLELNDLKTRFLGMAAHDLRNPLTVLRAYLELMREDGPPADAAEFHGMIQLMCENCDAMLNMVETYLDVSAIESGQLRLEIKEVNLSSFLSRIETLARVLAEPKNTAFTVELQPGVTTWTFDAYRMEQVVTNLISNAVKYSPPGSRVMLSLRRDGDGLEISVTDEGPGISAGDLPKLFKDFGRASTKPTAGEKSTGLGLAICRRIVHQHGGELRVHSEPGRGSTFSVRLIPHPPDSATNHD